MEATVPLGAVSASSFLANTNLSFCTRSLTHNFEPWVLKFPQKSAKRSAQVRQTKFHALLFTGRVAACRQLPQHE